MTPALIATVALSVLLAGALIALGWRHLRIMDARVAEQVAQFRRERELGDARDQALASLAQRDAELAAATFRVEAAEAEVSTLRRSRANADRTTVLLAPPDERGAAVDRVLEARAAEAGATADHRGPAPTPAVPGARTAPAEPTPSWVRP